MRKRKLKTFIFGNLLFWENWNQRIGSKVLNAIPLERDGVSTERILSRVRQIWLDLVLPDFQVCNIFCRIINSVDSVDFQGVHVDISFPVYQSLFGPGVYFRYGWIWGCKLMKCFVYPVWNYKLYTILSYITCGAGRLCNFKV